MKPKFLIIILTMAIFSSCVKDYQITPVKTDLTGMWERDDHQLTLVINNTLGVGNNAKIWEIKKSDGRYLKVETPNIDETFKISSLTNKHMQLTDTLKNVMSFDRIRE